MTSRLRSSGIAALSFTLSASVLALTLAPAMAHAATTTRDPVEVTVTGERQLMTARIATNDLNLASAAGMKRLNNRILGAIGQVCRDDVNGSTTAERVCRYEARVSADRQVAALRSEALALASGSSGSTSSPDIVVAAR
ncbi:UrcA family protein [Sphingomonas humi]|uniref:UrcA family protein n=1 Tax=Sphingomonas humi TaxID=335630 RepID=A0ABP7RT40_9SPHN